MAGFIEAEGLEWDKSKKFALIVAGFIGTLFSNVTSLRVRPHLQSNSYHHVKCAPAMGNPTNAAASTFYLLCQCYDMHFLS